MTTSVFARQSRFGPVSYTCRLAVGFVVDCVVCTCGGGGGVWMSSRKREGVANAPRIVDSASVDPR
ncbi:hypothetical protein P152DRAFT_456271 [Eremomyces bilateralis CBS 781.70]|uniref:Uncharacterized protein n=1 Tax=Eremomyces bilateralis CBS 781.70 TaxID=1392243 RepID=A0A6G1GBJ2_9PEZI|nr:uncharacterized protein P152DRAFT_456271 [Eremomyces bilateralis CBS 781.70]KAF1815219.1 hypothetical protein P152DRAFT_456271 [Eremomyces bilateralis CBS 781.70]